MNRQFIDRAADNMLRKAFGDGIPSVTELVKNTSIIFTNQHYSLSGAKPLSPAVIEVGGIHIKDAQLLNEHEVIHYIYNYVDREDLINSKLFRI